MGKTCFITSDYILYTQFDESKGSTVTFFLFQSVLASPRVLRILRCFQPGESHSFLPVKLLVMMKIFSKTIRGFHQTGLAPCDGLWCLIIPGLTNVETLNIPWLMDCPPFTGWTTLILLPMHQPTPHGQVRKGWCIIFPSTLLMWWLTYRPSLNYFMLIGFITESTFNKSWHNSHCLESLD